MSTEEALTVLDRFTEAFNRQDIVGMDATLHFPHIFSGSPAVIWPAPGSLPPDFFPKLLASGWRFSRYTKRDVLLTSADRVHILVEYERCWSDGSVLSKQSAVWIVARIDGKWGIQIRSNA